MRIIRVASDGPLGNRLPLAEGFDVITGAASAAERVDYASGPVEVGVWDCDAGILSLSGTTSDEYCLLIEGELTIIDEGGREERFSAGDAFVIPRGFVGRWVMSTRIRKHFVIVA